jgi:G3E family GTPase
LFVRESAEMASPSSKQDIAAAIADSLRDACILKQVFTFLPGHYLFLGAVCREWEIVYASMAEQQLRSCDLVYINKIVTCETKETLFSAAVASPATARQWRLIVGSTSTLRTKIKMNVFGLWLGCMLI